MAEYCGRIHAPDTASPKMKRQCEKVEDRIDIAACAYQWAAGVTAYPWTSGLTVEERKRIRDRVRRLGVVSNGRGVEPVRDARDEAALAVFAVLPL